MNSKGFTILELMIASALMVIALAGIATVYIVSDTFLHAGIAKVDIQSEARIVGERINRWIRPGTSAEISGDGDVIQIETLESISPLQLVTSTIYYSDEEIYYDNDIDDDTPSFLIVDKVYKLEQEDIFSKAGDLINVNFGIASDYQHGKVQPVEVSLKIKMRGAE